MKNAVWIIMKKELARFFGDRRLLMTTVLLPGLMIFLLYRFTGFALQNQMDLKNTTIEAEVAGLPETLREPVNSLDIHLKEISEGEIAEARSRIEKKKLDLCVVFPADFDGKVAAYETSSGEKAPLVQIYYNSAKKSSLGAYEQFTQLLGGYEELLCNKFDINDDKQDYDLATDKDATATVFSSMLPALLMMFLFSGCISVAPESIAGEKERGTIATLLVTPIKRGDIAFGKIGALSVIALLSALSSLAGTILSLPQLMRDEKESGAVLQTNVYHLSDYLLLAVVILSTVIVIVAVISIISAYANTIKEAQTMATPLTIIVMLIGLTAMFGEEARTEWQYYLIPLYNSVQCMMEIFSFHVIARDILLTVAANLACTGIGLWILTRMFHSEGMMFS